MLWLQVSWLMLVCLVCRFSCFIVFDGDAFVGLMCLYFVVDWDLLWFGLISCRGMGCCLMFGLGWWVW